MSNLTPFMRRSVLYVPAANARAMAKSWSLGADVIVFDLEDAVAPSAKAAARAALITQLAESNRGGSEVVIRVNALGTDELGRDMLARIIYGARLSLLCGVLPIGIAFVIGTGLGMSAGYAG